MVHDYVIFHLGKPE